MRYYAGIGARDTPQEVLEWMTRIALFMNRNHWCLRSGGAKGADSAFYIGGKSRCQIFLPWNGFSNFRVDNKSFFAYTEEARRIAEQFHPGWRRLNDAAKHFHSRNVHQVLGPDCKTPSEAVICWTKDGEASGGTGQALRIAKANKIPIVNLQHPPEKLPEFLRKLR